MIIVAYEGEKSLSLKEVLNEVKFRNLQQELSFAALNNFKQINTDLQTSNNKADKNEDEIKIAIIIGPEGGLEQKRSRNFKIIWCKICIFRQKNIKNRNCLQYLLTSIIMYELGDFGEV